ncbi:MAG: IS21 family transposase, partial [Thermodesulfobacteriota bacterium]|nr:IS21 family transposase [Thermodesulfobacteriota bacterium]
KLIEKQKIIISHFQKGKSQRQIARQMGLNRRTIAKYVKDYERKKDKLTNSKGNSNQEELIADIAENPGYDTSNRKKVKLTEEIIDRIKYYLKENESKRAEGKTKQQKKKIDIYEALKEKGFDLSYSTTCNTIRKIKKEAKEAYIRQEYEFGEVCEFDWGEVKLNIAGKKKTIQMSVFTTARGDYRWGNLYHNQKTEAFLDTTTSFFEEVDGVYKEMVYDNARVQVAKFVGRSEKEPTEALLKLSIYYGFRFRFTNNYQAHEKGHVERSVEYLRRKIFSKRDTFSSLEEARQYFKRELEKLNSKPRGNAKSAYEILQEEREYLLPLPPRYDTARITEVRADKYSCISIDSNHYSVPDHLVGKFIFTKIYPDKIIGYHNQKKIASHQRKYGKNEWSININHYLVTLKLKPGALKRSTAFAQIKPGLKLIYQKYYQGEEKSFIELLQLIADHNLVSAEQAITVLEKINPTGVNTEKIRMIIERKDNTGSKINPPSDIETQAKRTVNLYADMLNEVSA